MVEEIFLENTYNFARGSNTTSKKRGPRKIQRIYEAVTEEEFVKLLTITKKPHHRVYFTGVYGCGIRPSELKNLQPEDINFKDKKIMIRQGKGSKDRMVNLPKHWKVKDVQYFPMKISVRAIEAIFLRNSLKAGINKIIGYYNTKNGKKVPLYRLHVHSLRHSFATRSLEKGLPLHYLQTLMGHANLATTSRYTKANPIDAIQDIIDRGI